MALRILFETTEVGRDKTRILIEVVKAIICIVAICGSLNGLYKKMKNKNLFIFVSIPISIVLFFIFENILRYL